MKQPDWTNVLVVQTSFLGDVVLTLPLISAIKERFPVGKLTLLCSPLGKELLDLHPDIDEIIIDHKRGADSGWAGLRRKADLLSKRNFTIAICPHKSFRSALMLFLAKIPYRVGFRQSKGAMFFTYVVNRDPRRHEIERNLSILEPFGISSEECLRAPRFPDSVTSKEKVRQLFQAAGINQRKTLVGINPGSVWPTKRWAPQYFAELILRLKRELACDVILFGGPEDNQVIGTIQELCVEPVASVAGKTSVHDLPAALRACDLFVTNDSGPMHIAVAVDVPVVAIFCATTRDLGFYPYTNRAIVVEKEISCRPCGSHGGRRCPLGTEDCIRLVHPEHVIQAVKKLLTASVAYADVGPVPQALTV